MNDIHDSEKDLNNLKLYNRIKMEKLCYKQCVLHYYLKG